VNPLTQFKKTSILPLLIALTLACLAARAQANELLLQFVTGGDDLRGGSDNLNVLLLLQSGDPLRFDKVNGGQRWPDHSSRPVFLPLRDSVRFEDIKGVRLETTFGGGLGGDNWNLERLTVSAKIGGVTRQLFDQQQAPYLFRFTGDQRVREFPFPTGNELTVLFVTGDDDLRGGNDNVHLFLVLHAQAPLRFENVNGGNRWPDHSSQTVSLPLDAPVRFEDIEGVRLETTFGGGLGGDNWNLERLTVWARIGGVTRQLFDQRRAPFLFRFTGDQHVRPFYFGRGAGRFDFNLESLRNAIDPNGFPLNPRWNWQRDNPGVPSAALCHYFTNNNEPDFGDCTNQTDLSMVDKPVDFDEFICSLETTKGFHGHLNWFPATFTGTLSFGDHNFDDDYYLALGTDLNSDGKADGLACISGDQDPPRDTLHTEFNADETITHFQTPWWKSFRDAVDASEEAASELSRCPSPDAEPGGTPCDPALVASLKEAIAKPKKMLTYNDGKPVQAIMTGLFGLDFEHGGGKSELHPVYAMAANVKEDPADNVWTIFVRNTGNEGYCSHRIWYLLQPGGEFMTYTFRLPWREGMNDVGVLSGPNQSQFGGTDLTAGPSVVFAPGRGVDVRFRLPQVGTRPPSEGAALIEGELHLQWFGRPPVTEATRPPGHDRGRFAVAEVTTAASGTASVEKRDEAGPVREAINRLPPAKRRLVEKARQIAETTPLKLNPLPRVAAAKKVEELPTPPSVAVRPGAKSEKATRKLAQDAAQLRALCEAWDGSPPGLPTDFCSKIGR
jgi:hypothetical protein